MPRTRTIYFTEEADQDLLAVSEAKGLSHSATIALALRRLAKIEENKRERREK